MKIIKLYLYSKGYAGPKCECDLQNKESTSELDKHCYPNNTQTNDPVCDGHGKCNCGQCLCNDQHVGTYCRCLKSKCPKGPGGKVCSGNGVCVCKGDPPITKCECNSGWYGDNCACKDDDDMCTDKRTGAVCFDRGECQCTLEGKKCECYAGFTGKYCQKDNKDTCVSLEPCVLAKITVDQSEKDNFEKDCDRYRKFKETKIIYAHERYISCKLGDNIEAEEGGSHYYFATDKGIVQDFTDTLNYCTKVVNMLEADNIANLANTTANTTADEIDINGDQVIYFVIVEILFSIMKLTASNILYGYILMMSRCTESTFKI